MRVDTLVCCCVGVYGWDDKTQDVLAKQWFVLAQQTNGLNANTFLTKAQYFTPLCFICSTRGSHLSVVCDTPERDFM